MAPVDRNVLVSDDNELEVEVKRDLYTKQAFRYSFSDRLTSPDMVTGGSQAEEEGESKCDDTSSSHQFNDGDSWTRNSGVSLATVEFVGVSSPCRNIHQMEDSTVSSSTLPPSLTAATTTPVKPQEKLDGDAPRRIALLAIDLQNDFLGNHDKSFYFCTKAVRTRGGSGKRHPFASGRREALLTRIACLCHEVQALGGVVCFVKSVYGTPHSAAASSSSLLASLKTTTNAVCCAAGTAGCEFHPDAEDLLTQLQQHNEERGRNCAENQEVCWVLTKQWYSAFLETVLHCQLQRLGITDILVTGVTTNHSVAATVRSAHHLGYRVALSMDGTAQLNPKLQMDTCNKLSPYCHMLLQPNASVLEILGMGSPTSCCDDSCGESASSGGSHDGPVVSTNSISNNVRLLQERLRQRLVFDGCVRLSGIGAGDSILIPDVLATRQADDLLQEILNKVEINGPKNSPTNNNNNSSSTHLPPEEWNKVVGPVRKHVEHQAGHSMNWSRIHYSSHPSKETALDCSSAPNQYGAILILGEGRVLQLVPKVATEVLAPQTIYMHHNSLLLIGYETQQQFDYTLHRRKKKRRVAAPRISISFGHVNDPKVLAVARSNSQKPPLPMKRAASSRENNRSSPAAKNSSVKPPPILVKASSLPIMPEQDLSTSPLSTDSDLIYDDELATPPEQQQQEVEEEECVGAAIENEQVEESNLLRVVVPEEEEEEVEEVLSDSFEKVLCCLEEYDSKTDAREEEEEAVDYNESQETTSRVMEETSAAGKTRDKRETSNRTMSLPAASLYHVAELSKSAASSLPTTPKHSNREIINNELSESIHRLVSDFKNHHWDLASSKPQEKRESADASVLRPREEPRNEANLVQLINRLENLQRPKEEKSEQERVSLSEPNPGTSQGEIEDVPVKESEQNNDPVSEPEQIDDAVCKEELKEPAVETRQARDADSSRRPSVIPIGLDHLIEPLERRVLDLELRVRNKLAESRHLQRVIYFDNQKHQKGQVDDAFEAAYSKLLATNSIAKAPQPQKLNVKEEKQVTAVTSSENASKSSVLPLQKSVNPDQQEQKVAQQEQKIADAVADKPVALFTGRQGDGDKGGDKIIEMMRRVSEKGMNTQLPYVVVDAKPAVWSGSFVTAAANVGDKDSRVQKEFVHLSVDPSPQEGSLSTGDESSSLTSLNVEYLVKEKQKEESWKDHHRKYRHRMSKAHASASPLETFLHDGTVAVAVGVSVLALLTAGGESNRSPTMGEATGSVLAAFAATSCVWWQRWQQPQQKQKMEQQELQDMRSAQ